MRRLLIIATIFAFWPAFASAQALDAFMYKGSHNSYRRPFPNDPISNPRLPLNEQVARWNCYELELDVCRKDDGTNELVIKHDCLPGAQELSFPGLLEELLSDPLVLERFTFINIERKLSDCCNSAGNCAVIFDELWDEFEVVGALYGLPNSVYYTPMDFAADHERWPTVTELVRRGKHFAISVNANCASDPYDRMFLRTNPNDTGGEVLNVDGTPDLTQYPAPPSLIDRHVWRNYPNGDGQQAVPPFRWTWALNNGINLVTTNDIRAVYSNIEYRLMCPIPLYVNPASNGDIANGTLGTYYNAAPSLQFAAQRIALIEPQPSAPILVRLSEGTHTVVPSSAPQLTTPMLLTVSPGSGPALIELP